MSDPIQPTSSSARRRDVARSLAGDLLRRAESHPEPDVQRLVEAVPTILAEAERRRHAGTHPEIRLSAAAAFWLPRLAALSAVLLAAALLWPDRSSTETTASPASDSAAVEAWIATGTASRLSDPVLDALVR